MGRHDLALAGGMARRAQALIDVDAEFPAEGPRRSVRIWRNLRCIAVPASESRLDRFPVAAQAASARGWPVATRCSGGLAVPHGPDVLCLSLVWMALEPPGPDAAFGALADLIRRSVLDLGVRVDVGQVDDAVCPGAWDLAIGGRKIAGLAQRRTAPRPDGRTGVLAHAAIFCGLDFQTSVGAINDYYSDLNVPRTFEPGAHANVAGARALPHLAKAIEVMAAQAGFAGRGG